MHINRRREISNTNCDARSSDRNESTVSEGHVRNEKAERALALSGCVGNTTKQRRKTKEILEIEENKEDRLTHASVSTEEEIDGKIIRTDVKHSSLENVFHKAVFPITVVSDSGNLSRTISVATATRAFDSDCVEYDKSRLGATSDTTSFSSIDLEAQLDKTGALKLPPLIDTCTSDGKPKLGKSTFTSLFSGKGAEAQADDTLSTGESSASVSAAASHRTIKETHSGRASTDSILDKGRSNHMAQMKNLGTKESCQIEKVTKEMNGKIPAKSLRFLCCLNIVGMKRTTCLGILVLSLVCLSGLMWFFFVLAGRTQGKGEITTLELVSSSTPTPLPSLTVSSRPSNIPTSMLSQNPSNSPSSVPTSFPSSLPSFLPSAMPSRAPSTFPSFKPSTVPSTKPSLAPSPKPTFEPTLLPSKAPTLKPTNKPTHPSNHGTFSFYAMGDVPYSTKEMKVLRKQLKDIAGTSKDDALFMVHVGDIFTPKKS